MKALKREAALWKRRADWALFAFGMYTFFGAPFVAIFFGWLPAVAILLPLLAVWVLLDREATRLGHAAFWAKVAKKPKEKRPAD